MDSNLKNLYETIMNIISTCWGWWWAKLQSSRLLKGSAESTVSCKVVKSNGGVVVAWSGLAVTCGEGDLDLSLSCNCKQKNY